MDVDQRCNSLYSSEYEHDACGIAMVVNIHGNKSHNIVTSALRVLENMEHRGAETRDKTGDGAGIMVQIPHEFILLQGIPVPEKGRYGTGLMFLPRDKQRQNEIMDIVAGEVEKASLQLMPLRTVPVNPDVPGDMAREASPEIVQIFVCCTDDSQVPDLQRRLYKLRKAIERRVDDNDFYICSLSSTVLIYKGMLTSGQLRRYFPDLSNRYFTSSLAIVHSRFSTNTFPNWKLAQPFRYLCHNGEINAVRGNREWIKAREYVLSSPILGDISEIRPILQEGMSDSASLDNVLEFLLMSGMSLPHAMSILVPESFNDLNPISEELKAFYEYWSILMEPWDGPAALLFSDGRYAGGLLDSKGLRPCRYTITTQGMLVVASEVGVMDIDPKDIQSKGRLESGKIMMVDTQEGRIYYDGELKQELADAYPYHKWLHCNCIQLEKIRTGRKVTDSVEAYSDKLKYFGITAQDIDDTILPMCSSGNEKVTAMGYDLPLTVLSGRSSHFFDYFRQQFAQVTNPAIDPIREDLVMSLTGHIGRVGTGILNPSGSNCKMVRMEHPVITNAEMDILCHLGYKGFNTVKLPILFRIDEGEQGLNKALEGLCAQAEVSIEEGVNYIILSDRDIDAEHAAIPSLLALSAVHHHLKKVGKRVQTALIVESGEVWDVMHIALLIGYGASAINPYMAFAVVDDLVKEGRVNMELESARRHYVEATSKGIKKIMSKMGISNIRSYRGAKIFESIGLSAELLDKYFGGQSSSIGGIGLKEIAADAIAMHEGGIQAYTRHDHAWNPLTISKLQKAVREGDYELFKRWSEIVDNKPQDMFIRDLLEVKTSAHPIPLEEVEPEESIIRHFVSGAMSYGALSKEAHELLASAMNRLGTRSNSGEGGEDRHRYAGNGLCSKTKQLASGRFGVTAEYLVNADEIQIKAAQGAKPGEGGQLPGFKVDEFIARTRHSLPGITLISPPPHHDVYSIEDLAQLIYDLKNINPKAAVSVKLVAESGVGTIAAGVAKAKADLIVISGADGGTGASPASSTRYAGIPAEIGLAETQQTLVRNGLRDAVRLQVDGQLKTARDVLVMAMLGADEFAFGTLPMIVMGCIMDRKCNLNSCPVGIATQDPALRAKFKGKEEHIVNYFTFLARHLREYLAAMGVRSLKQIIGRSDKLLPKAQPEGSKAATLQLDRLLYFNPHKASRYWDRGSYTTVGRVLDEEIIRASVNAVEYKEKVCLEYNIHNTDRAACTMLSGVIARKWGEEALPDGTIELTFRGSAGQSFGAFAVKGLDIRLEGETNDYFGKGLCGAVMSIVPPADINPAYDAHENVIAGNTGLYGATSGEVYVNGKVGERFAVRNSGAVAVVEGAGDHCCEYMTGGCIVVLGPTGRNFAAGMSGGVAYVLDSRHDFDSYCNMDMVELGLVEDSQSAEQLHSLLERHYERTSSALAARLLENWPACLGDFIKIIPTEYKNITENKR